MLRKILEQKEKQANNVFDVDLLGDTSADEKKIIKILNEQPLDKIAVKLTRLKDSCRNVHNGTFVKRYNYIMSRVLLHDQYIGSAKVFSENKEKLELLIKSAERDQGIFQDSAVDFYNALLFCYDEQNSLDEKYAKILEFSFAIEDRLANAERYFDKKTEHQKIIDLRDKLVKLFVDNEEIAEGIENLATGKSICYKSFKGFYNNKILFDKYLDILFKKIDKIEKKSDFIHDLLYPWEHNSMHGLVDIFNEKHFENKKSLFDFLEKVYFKYCDKKSADYIGYEGWIIFLTMDNDKYNKISGHGDDLRESEKERFENTIIYEIKNEFNF